MDLLVFDEMPMKDVVAWTTLVIGNVQNGDIEKGLNCLCEIRRVGEECERPNFRTFEWWSKLWGFGRSERVDIAWVPMIFNYRVLSIYSKCAAAEEAYCSFSIMDDKDLISWMAT
ncbi:hypothetical protein Ancab_003428 [Ancistrocladus abbreviatus]